MPTYQYVCTECGQDLEAVQSFSDAALTECPACSGRLRKKFGSVGVVFKGSGFYRTDSRSGNGASTAASSSSSSSDKSESSSDSKPAEKPAGADKPAAKKDSGSSSSSSGSTTTAA